MSRDRTTATMHNHDLESGKGQHKTSSRRRSSPENITDTESKIQHDGPYNASRYKILNRIKHFTWAWYTTTMGTGGIALLLSSQTHTFRGLETIGKAFFILDLILFAGFTATICIRFLSWPGTLTRSLTHPTESLFFATSWISLSSIIACMQRYGVSVSGPWLIVAIRVCFWAYIAMSLSSAILQYYYLFTAKALTAHSMTPSWIIPIFPVMLSGTLASVCSKSQPHGQAMPIIVAGVAFQGLGFCVAMILYPIYIGRLVQYGLPDPNLRPSMFIAVGPPSFTALALIGIAGDIPQSITYFGDPTVAKEALTIMATFVGVFLWIFGFWFFAVALIACLSSVKQMSFHLVWWAFVFPNVGFTIATISIGEKFQSQGVTWVGSALTILLVAMWLFVAGSQIMAVSKGKIMQSGSDEDQ